MSPIFYSHMVWRLQACETKSRGKFKKNKIIINKFFVLKLNFLLYKLLRKGNKYSDIEFIVVDVDIVDVTK